MHFLLDCPFVDGKYNIIMFFFSRLSADVTILAALAIATPLLLHSMLSGAHFQPKQLKLHFTCCCCVRLGSLCALRIRRVVRKQQQKLRMD